ncbi:MAG TPA: hypothetical protein VFV38_48550 [Ktedonobacteraceae bacterium]|nr:hypothetical protein [Ktedonobacteraceae bacterium]
MNSSVGNWPWKPNSKKNVTAVGVPQRHATIMQAHQEHPELSIAQLCDLLDVGRSWYYERDDLADPEHIAL